MNFNSTKTSVNTENMKVSPETFIRRVNVKSDDNDSEVKVELPADDATKKDKVTDPESNNIFSMLQPFIKVMSLSGMCLHAGSRGWRIVTGVYATFILLTMLFSLVRMFSLFGRLEELSLSSAPFTISLMATLWIINCSVNTLTFYILSWKDLHVKIYRRMDDLALHTSRLRRSSFRRYVFFAITGCFAYVTSNVSLFIYLCYDSHVFEFVFLHPARADMLHATIPLYVTYVIASTTWIVPFVYEALLVAMMCTMFREHEAALERKITEDLTQENVEKMRLRFNELCNFVIEADVVCAPLNGANYTVNVAVVLMILYGGIFTSEESLGGLSLATWITVITIWVLLCTAYLAVPSILGSVLNIRAHASNDTLHKINFLSEEGKSVHSQVTIHLAKLMADKIGVSVLHMFVLDREAILKIMGFVVTYFILLVQIGALSPSKTCVSVCYCNNTAAPN